MIKMNRQSNLLCNLYLIIIRCITQHEVLTTYESSSDVIISIVFCLKYNPLTTSPYHRVSE